MKEKFKAPSRLIVAEYIVGEVDMQRSHQENVEPSQITEIMKDLIRSCEEFRIPLYVLTNVKINFESDFIHFVEQPIESSLSEISLYFKRWIMAFQFLSEHSEIEEIFFVDAGDVEVINYPFHDLKKNRLYMSDEGFDLNSSIVVANDAPKEIKKFLEINKNLQLLDPGVVGGKREIVMEFLSLLANQIARGERKFREGVDNGIGVFEMAIISYVSYNFFSERLIHGRKITTMVFQNKRNSYSWFKHK